jgi:pimeloyl-ACP methyl ester carboxylesterase
VQERFKQDHFDTIPGAGHALNLDQPEIVNLEFLGKGDGSAEGIETS